MCLPFSCFGEKKKITKIIFQAQFKQTTLNNSVSKEAHHVSLSGICQLKWRGQQYKNSCHFHRSVIFVVASAILVGSVHKFNYNYW